MIAVGCANSTQESFKSIMIPVRDGTNLATDLYFPSSISDSYPVILIRTPYSKKLLKEYGEFYSKQGYNNKQEMADDIIAILREELTDLQEAGCELVQFDEPGLTEIVMSEDCDRRTFM